jgi:hypothetical protein
MMHQNFDRSSQPTTGLAKTTTVLFLSCILIASCKDKGGSGGANPTNPTNAAVNSGGAPSSVKSVQATTEEPQQVSINDVKLPKLGGTVSVSWDVPKGTTVNDEAPFSLRWKTSEGLIEVPEPQREKGSAVRDGFSVKVKPAPGLPEAKLIGDVSLVVCDSETHAVCVTIKRRLEMSFVVTEGAPSTASVRVSLPSAKSK